MTIGEKELVELVKKRAELLPEVGLGIGDDAALLNLRAKGALVAVDMLMDGVHFQLDKDSPVKIGHKALAVNLSDIAAMGGKPVAAFVAVALPRSFSTSLWQDMFEGLSQLCSRHKVAIAGGDTNTWDGPFVISVTVVGEPHKNGVITRAGGKLGDAILVTGPLGGSFVAKHLEFEPRLEFSRMLMENYNPHAMIDLSDGLASDLRAICQASGLAARLSPDAIPISPVLLKALRREEALERALTDGEDFELCFCVSSAEAQKILKDSRLPCQASVIGRLTDDPLDLYWETRDNTIERITLKGFEHNLR